MTQPDYCAFLMGFALEERQSGSQAESVVSPTLG